jgi:hypothetical protein
MTSDDRAELARLRAAVISTLTTLRAELDAPSLTRSVVAEHHLADLAALVGVEWKPPAFVFRADDGRVWRSDHT